MTVISTPALANSLRIPRLEQPLLVRPEFASSQSLIPRQSLFYTPILSFQLKTYQRKHFSDAICIFITRKNYALNEVYIS